MSGGTLTFETVHVSIFFLVGCLHMEYEFVNQATQAFCEPLGTVECYAGTLEADIICFSTMGSGSTRVVLISACGSSSVK